MSLMLGVAWRTVWRHDVGGLARVCKCGVPAETGMSGGVNHAACCDARHVC